ncbi:hypothetical protein D3C76_1431510 [compost metagenome]
MQHRSGPGLLNRRRRLDCRRRRHIVDGELDVHMPVQRFRNRGLNQLGVFGLQPFLGEGVRRAYQKRVLVEHGRFGGFQPGIEARFADLGLDDGQDLLP